uniref:PHD-type domain-containing protein n=1 Tax=Cairina moschata TaxID=8855 RepID=A0A8C3BB34_CAIMO
HTLGPNRPLGTVPQGLLAPQRCSMTEPFSLSLPACMLCGRVDVDVNVCGQTYELDGLCVHLYCMIFANSLYQRGCITEGTAGILPEDIQLAIRQASEKQCFVCGERGATITCTVTGCERCFHLPCASEGECVTHYFGQFRDMPCVQAFSASSRCPTWGSKSQSGRYPSTLLSRHEGTSAVHS